MNNNTIVTLNNPNRKREKIKFPNEGIQINYDFLTQSHDMYQEIKENTNLLQRNPAVYFEVEEIYRKIYLNNLRIYKNCLI